MIACDYANGRNGFPPTPVYGILCDGQSFRFFSFDGSTEPPTISQGVFGPEEHQTLSLTDLTSTPTGFILSLRPVCEIIFSFLLLGYTTGLQGYYERSVEMGLADSGEYHRVDVVLQSWDRGF